MLMAEAGHCGASRGIEDLAAIFGDQPCAFAANRFRWRFVQAPVQHAARAGSHHHQPFSRTYSDIATRRASVSSRRFLARTPPVANVTAASACAMATAPVRL